MARPKYCPNCATKLPKGSHGAQPFSKDEEGVVERGWDCYCEICEWSGDIHPDDESDSIFEMYAKET